MTQQSPIEKELALMEQIKEKAIYEWKAFDIPTIDSIISKLKASEETPE